MSAGHSDLVRLLGRYLNLGTEVERIRGLCERAAAEHVERTYSRTSSARARRYRSDEVDVVVAKYHETRSIRAVARELGMSRTTVIKYLAERGVRTTRHMSDADIDRAVSLHGDGLSCAAIARQVRFDGKTIAKELRARGVIS